MCLMRYTLETNVSLTTTHTHNKVRGQGSYHLGRSKVISSRKVKLVSAAVLKQPKNLIENISDEMYIRSHNNDPFMNFVNSCLIPKSFSKLL